MRTNPVYASVHGDKRSNDKLDDASQEFIDKDIEETKKFLARFEAIDTTGFPQQEVLNPDFSALRRLGALRVERRRGSGTHVTSWPRVLKREDLSRIRR